MTEWQTLFYGLATTAFAFAFFLLGLLCVAAVVYLAVAFYRWAQGGGLAHLTKGLSMIDNRSGVIAPTEADSWRIDKELEREEERRR